MKCGLPSWNRRGGPKGRGGRSNSLKILRFSNRKTTIPFFKRYRFLDVGVDQHYIAGEFPTREMTLLQLSPQKCFCRRERLAQFFAVGFSGFAFLDIAFRQRGTEHVIYHPGPSGHPSCSRRGAEGNRWFIPVTLIEFNRDRSTSLEFGCSARILDLHFRKVACAIRGLDLHFRKVGCAIRRLDLHARKVGCTARILDLHIRRVGVQLKSFASP
jgi:hypothetical protein